MGFLLHLTKGETHHPVKSLEPVGAYHCAGARSDVEAEAITLALKHESGPSPDIAHYRLGAPANGNAKVWLAGNDYSISRH